MPRDLESAKATLESLPSLTKDADDASPHASEPFYFTPTEIMAPKYKKMKDLHPYSLLLSQDDLDDCDWLEHAAFDAHEAATREKLDYRLHVCGELCSGIYTSSYATAPAPLGRLLRSRDFPSTDSSDSDRKKILLGHIIATKHAAPVVTDESMDFPKDWRENYQMNPSTGHNEDGQTICLHSLGIHPEFQKRGLGKVLLEGWSQRMRDSGIAKRIALICHEKFIKFYEASGFKNMGESKCTYAGGGWYDMVMEFEGSKQGSDY